MKKKRVILMIVGAVVLVLGYIYVGPLIQLANGLVKKGVLEKAENRTYSGGTADNLRALYTAIMFVHESDGQFPDASKWMDAVKMRIQSGDMTAEESQKKLLDPALGGKQGAYGFAMNDACSNKYKGDLKDPKTILLFESSDTKWNAHGDPTAMAPKPPRSGQQNLAITVGGDVVSF